jgi:outer membrane protein OmpA-like peptidoglycan-associated protein
MAEDARIITVKRIEEERLANERSASASREASAKADADAAEARRQQAEQDRQLSEQQRMAAVRERQAAERAKADADASRAAALAAQQQAQTAQQQAQAAQQQAEAEAERAKQAAADADAQRVQAENDKTRMRAQLLQQLNMILETRDTARGLIVNMSDVLFDTAKFTLRPGAREKLAKVSGILLAYPGLRIQIEGHTDNVGGDEYNQKLSEQRADSVRDYLVQQGVGTGAVSAVGFGKARPVTTNDTATGRQQNRRVELVVSGDVIGQELGSGRQ